MAPKLRKVDERGAWLRKGGMNPKGEHGFERGHGSEREAWLRKAGEAFEGSKTKGRGSIINAK